jgi:hypothetical protein
VARTAETVRAEIDSLRSAMSQGAVSVSYEGRSVTYRNYADMRAALDDLLEELAALEGRERGHTKYAVFSRGYYR